MNNSTKRLAGKGSLTFAEPRNLLHKESTMIHSCDVITSSADFPQGIAERCSARAGLKLLLFFLTVCCALLCAATRAGAQALGADNSRRYDQNAYLEAHAAFTTPSANYICWIYCNQDRSIDDQLDAGVRSLDLRIWKVRQFKYAANYQARIYNDDGSTKDTFDNDLIINDGYGRHDPEIVLGHHIWDSGLGYLEGGLGIGSFTGALYPLENYRDRLEKIVAWLARNPNEVVTLNVSSSVPEDSIYLTRQAFEDIHFGPGFMFILGDYVNTGMLPPHGRAGGLRPSPDGWWFPMDGMPTLQYLIKRHKRLVYHDGKTFERTSFHNVFVDSDYGNKTVPKGCDGEHDSNWSDKDGKDIDDFTVPLFIMQHVRDDPEPTHDFTKCVQDIKWLKNKLTDIEARWHRLPNFLRVDHAVKTTEISGASNSFDGPKEFVNYLNQRWAEQAPITPTWTLSAKPNGFGWNNTDVTVQNMWGDSTDTIQQVVYKVFGPPDEAKLTPNILEDSSAKYPTSATVSGEGKFVVSFYAVGSQGNASDRGYIDIWIDKTPPTIVGAAASRPNAYGWYKSNVTINFFYGDMPGQNPDFGISGIDEENSTPKLVLSTEGKNQSVTGKATDKAGNVQQRTLEGLNLDKTNPTITYTGNPGYFTPDQFINIICTPADNLSGVRVHTCQNIMGEGYSFVQGSQKVSSYSYSAEATDYADNKGSGSTSFTVTVTPQSVSNLTARFVTNAGVANSLQQKLRQAAEAEARGDLKGKAHHVDIYVKELENHTGRFVTAENAATLIRLARAF